MMHAAKRSDRSTPARERGMALLVVLWIIVAAALIVSAFNATVKSGVSFIGSEVQLSKTEALLDAGVEIAAARLIDEEEARRWVPDGRSYTVAFAGAELAIAITDTGGAHRHQQGGQGASDGASAPVRGLRGQGGPAARSHLAGARQNAGHKTAGKQG